MIITLTMNPAVDKTAELKEIEVGGLNRLQNVMMDAGGKGINVSKTIKNLGGDSLAVGVLAGNSGAFIESELNRFNIHHDFIKIEGNTRTNLKVVDQDRVLTEFNENGPSPNEEQLKVLTDKIINQLKANDILVISGSVPSDVKTTYYYDLITMAKTKKAKVILDADRALFKEGIKAIPSIIKPNKYELLQYFNKDEASEEEMLSLANTLIDKGIELVVISMGKEGAYFVSKEATFKAEAIKVEAHSSVGAGDAMVAALAYAYEKNMCIEEVVKLCCAAGAGAVMTKGTKPSSREEIDQLIKKVVYKKL